ncbi:putative DD34D transposase [Trichonephila clavipes]|nr:putative DD34D transposase [Trichonephila clavipes]
MEVRKLSVSQKIKEIPSKIKTMLLTFFDARYIIHKEFDPIRQTVTGQYYLAVLKRLKARIQRIRAEYRTERSWCFSSIFRTKNTVCVFNHTSYSPDVALCVYSLFPNFKMKLVGCYFDDVLTLQVASTPALQAVPQCDLQQVFNSLINHYSKCIETGGSFF